MKTTLNTLRKLAERSGHTELVEKIARIQISQREMAEIRAHQQRERELTRMAMFEAGINYELTVIYDNPNPTVRKKVDFIPLEGWQNANLIFNEYYETGFSKNLFSITLTLDEKVVRKVTFKK